MATLRRFRLESRRKGHINLRKITGTPAGCPWDMSAGQTGVYRPVSQGVPVVYYGKIDRKGHVCWDTGQVSRRFPAVQGLFRSLMWFVLICLFCSLCWAYRNPVILRVTLLVGIEMSFFGHRDFLIFFSVSRSSLTSNLQDVEAQKGTHRLIPGSRGYRCWTTECRISIPKKRSRHQKGDLGHLDTTKKTSRYRKKMDPSDLFWPKFGQKMRKIISLHDVLEPLKQALLASRDVIISSQICTSNLQKVFTLGDGCWLPG